MHSGKDSLSEMPSGDNRYIGPFLDMLPNRALLCFPSSKSFCTECCIGCYIYFSILELDRRCPTLHGQGISVFPITTVRRRQVDPFQAQNGAVCTFSRLAYMSSSVRRRTDGEPKIHLYSCGFTPERKSIMA